MYTSLCRFRRVCVLNPEGLVGNLRCELSYAKAIRRYLCQLDVVFVVILD